MIISRMWIMQMTSPFWLTRRRPLYRSGHFWDNSVETWFTCVLAKAKIQTLSAGDSNISNLSVSEHSVEEVTEFTYLGSVLSTTSRCQPDIFRQIGIASSTMHSMSRVWRQTRLQLQTKLCLYQTCILPILLHGSEAWTLLQKDLWKLKAFHMRCQRTILVICWYDFVRNTEVIAITNLPSFQDIINKRRTHCSVMWWDLTIILWLIVHCPRSQQLESVPASITAGANTQAARATRGYNRSATVPLLASALKGGRSKASRSGHSR